MVNYKRLLRVKGSKEVIRGYRVLQGVIRGYKGLQVVRGGYKRLQGVTGGYKTVVTDSLSL